MAEYALIKDGTIAEFRQIADVTGSQIGPHPSGKPFLLPVEVSGPAFDPVSQFKDGPFHTIEVARVLRSFTVRAKNAAEINTMRDGKIAEVRAQGDSRLGQLVSLAKQINALTRLVQLLYLNTTRTGWPAQQQTLATAMLVQLTNIQNIRQAEETKVAEVQALATPEQISAYDTSAGWS